jgi:hypothetical protein
VTRTCTFAAACALALSAALGATAAASGLAAHASKTCSLTLDQQRRSGSTYLVSLGATNVSCPSGLSVEKAFQSCRRSTAGRRTCRKSVSGYKCTQTVLDSSKTQYDAKVSCTAGKRAVRFTYTQNV